MQREPWESNYKVCEIFPHILTNSIVCACVCVCGGGGGGVHLWDDFIDISGEFKISISGNHFWN